VKRFKRLADVDEAAGRRAKVRRAEASSKKVKVTLGPLRTEEAADASCPHCGKGVSAASRGGRS
jgi:hypothetical protein